MKRIKKGSSLEKSNAISDVLAKLRNRQSNLHNKIIAPILRERKEKFFTNKIVDNDYNLFRKNKIEGLKLINSEIETTRNDLFFGKMYEEHQGNNVKKIVLDARENAEIDWARFIDMVGAGQPGTLIQGSEHPCNLYYQRMETKKFSHIYGPDLNPQDYSLTSFFENKIDDNKFQVSFKIDGLVDEEYSSFYSSNVGFSTFFSAVRHGRISFEMDFDFPNAYIFARGDKDFWWWDDNDKGYSGAYFTIIIDRYRDGINNRIYNTWNNVLGDRYFQTDKEVLIKFETDSRNTAHQNPGGDNAPWYYPIPYRSIIIDRDNCGNIIEMQPDDQFEIIVNFLFYAQAYGDEWAQGGINIHNMFGSTGYGEVKPLKVYLEECPDKK